MTTLTLLVKAFNPRQLKVIDDLLKTQFEELDVEIMVLGAPVGKWVQVSVLGEDEEVASNYIRQEFGICPVSLEKDISNSILKGYISKVDNEKNELIVDIGLTKPKTIYAYIPAANLQTQLFGGKQVPLIKASQLYGLTEQIPIYLKILPDDGENIRLKAELSSAEIEKLISWRDSILDRLIVLRLSREEVERVVDRTHLERDVINVEKLGVFENALTCKLGTEAAGLIPRVGRYMRNGRFAVFSARKIRDFLSEQGLVC